MENYLLLESITEKLLDSLTETKEYTLPQRFIFKMTPKSMHTVIKKNIKDNEHTKKMESIKRERGYIQYDREKNKKERRK